MKDDVMTAAPHGASTAAAGKSRADYTRGNWRAERSVDMAGFETNKLWILMNEAPCAYDFDNPADAVLAAAAPQMYEALKDIYDFLRRSGYDTRFVKAAIDKAEVKI